MQSKLAIVTLVVVLAFVSVRAQEPPEIKHVPAPSTSPTSGSEMFRAYCAVCHGTGGKGDGPAVPALRKQPPDLTHLSKANGGKFPTFRVSNIILGDVFFAAHGSKDMPMWGNVFRSANGEESLIKLRVHNLAEYIESLQQN